MVALLGEVNWTVFSSCGQILLPFQNCLSLLIVMLKPLAANGLFGTVVSAKRVLIHAVSPAWEGKQLLKNYTCHSELSSAATPWLSGKNSLGFWWDTWSKEQFSVSREVHPWQGWSRSCFSVLWWGCPLTAPSHCAGQLLGMHQQSLCPARTRQG